MDIYRIYTRIDIIVFLLALGLIFSVLAKYLFKVTFKRCISIYIVITIFNFAALISFSKYFIPLLRYHMYAQTSVMRSVLPYLSEHRKEWNLDNVSDFLKSTGSYPSHATIYIGNLVIKPSENTPSSFQMKIKPYYVDSDNFLIISAENLDTDKEVDMWSIDERGNCIHLKDDFDE